MSTAPVAPTADEQLLVRRTTPRRVVPNRHLARLDTIHHALAAVEHDAARQAALARQGFGPERIAQGRQLYTTALEQHAEQRRRHERERDALLAYESAIASTQIAFAQLSKVARVALKQHPALRFELGFDGVRRRGAAWQEWAARFCTTALETPAILAPLSRLGITPARLRSAQELLAMVQATQALAQRDQALAEQAALRRNVAFADLDAWYAEFRAAHGGRGI